MGKGERSYQKENRMSRANQIIEEIETTVQQEIDPEAVKSNFSSVLPQGWQALEVKINEKGELIK